MRTLYIAWIVVLVLIIAAISVLSLYQSRNDEVSGFLGREEPEPERPNDYGSIEGTLLSFKTSPGGNLFDITLNVNKIVEYKRHPKATWPALREGDTIVARIDITEVEKLQGQSECQNGKIRYENPDGTVVESACVESASSRRTLGAEEGSAYLSSNQGKTLIVKIWNCGSVCPDNKQTWWGEITIEK